MLADGYLVMERHHCRVGILCLQELVDEVEARTGDGEYGALVGVCLDKASAMMFVAPGLYSTEKSKPSSLLT